MMNKSNETTTNRHADPGHDCASALAGLLPSNLRARLREQFLDLWRQRPHTFHLAMTEAAALAWQTGFPELFLPTLAEEKAQHLAAWNRRQEIIRGGKLAAVLPT